MPTPAEQPEISIKNFLFSNWQISNPAKDTVAETFNPTKLCMTTRYWAPNPQRIHRYQISVLGGDAKKTIVEVGAVAMYQVDEVLEIHLWVVAGIGQDWETAENSLRAMLTHVDDIIRIGSIQVSGIQVVRASPDWRVLDDRQNRLVLHRVMEVTAVYYETLTSLPIPITTPVLLADIGAADQNTAG